MKSLFQKSEFTTKMKLILLFSFFVLASCKKSPLVVDVSGIESEVQIERFDRDLFELRNTKDKQKKLDELHEKYGDFLELYSSKIIEIGSYQDSSYLIYLNKFLKDTVMNEVYDSVQHIFPDVEKQEIALGKAFKYYKYYFPEKKIPVVYTHISGFNQSIIIAENLVSVSLENYLGASCSFYEKLGIYEYLRIGMNPDRIPMDILFAMGMSEIPTEGATKNLISNMIYQGKVRYFLQAMFPKAAETDIMKYTTQQLQWCKNNEASMWASLIENKNLFSSDYATARRYINESPFTIGFPRESPGQTGIWLGLQIVKSYAEKNNIHLVELMTDTDYDKILRMSGYNPK